MSELCLNVRLIFPKSFGDHSEMVVTSHEVKEGETVENLVCRLMKLGEFQRRGISPISPESRIEIQYVAGTEPEIIF